LRPETAQGIFVNFKNIYQSARKRPPFGIAQIGKSFRNEITPATSPSRARIRTGGAGVFVPDDGNDVAVYEQWVAARKQWYSDYGVRADRLRFYELTPQERRTTRRPGPTSSTSSRGAGASSSRSRTAAPTISTRT